MPVVIAACGNGDDADDPANGDDPGLNDDDLGLDDQPDMNGDDIVDEDPNGADPNGDDPANGEEPPLEGDPDQYNFDEANETEAGVLYIDEQVGDGAEPTNESVVQVHYQGMLMDGTLFDSSHVRGQPEVFMLTDVIEGFADGIVGMQEGGERVLLVPPELAYGEDGIEDPGTGVEIVPPDAELIFEIELISVED